MEKKIEKENKSQGNVAVIRVRGNIGINQDIKDTLRTLRLYNNNYCIVLPKNGQIMGMIKKAKDYITWGDIDDETFKLLCERRGEEYKDRVKDNKGKISYNKFFSFNGKNLKKVFRLNPPIKGYGRKGIKVPFSKGGALGNRAEKINDLIKRML